LPILEIFIKYFLEIANVVYDGIWDKEKQANLMVLHQMPSDIFCDGLLLLSPHNTGKYNYLSLVLIPFFFTTL